MNCSLYYLSGLSKDVVAGYLNFEQSFSTMKSEMSIDFLSMLAIMSEILYSI